MCWRKGHPVDTLSWELGPPEPVSVWPPALQWLRLGTVAAVLEEGGSGSRRLRYGLGSEVPECYLCHVLTGPACPRPARFQGRGRWLRLSMWGDTCTFRHRRKHWAIFGNCIPQLWISLWNAKSWKNFRVGLWKFWCPVWESNQSKLLRKEFLLFFQQSYFLC